jgi:hypothetical protein
MCLGEANASYSDITWSVVSSSAPHFIHTYCSAPLGKAMCSQGVITNTEANKTPHCTLLKENSIVFSVT